MLGNVLSVQQLVFFFSTNTHTDILLFQLYYWTVPVSVPGDGVCVWRVLAAAG